MEPSHPTAAKESTGQTGPTAAKSTEPQVRGGALSKLEDDYPDLIFVKYDSTKEHIYLPLIRSLISKDLSEPYSIYVYRYFLYQWGHLCFLAFTTKSWQAHQAAINGHTNPSSSNHSTPSDNKKIRSTKSEIDVSVNSGTTHSHGPSRTPPPLDLTGIIINKLEPHTRHSPPSHTPSSHSTSKQTYRAPLRGYIAMLAVQSTQRGRGIATRLVELAITEMDSGGADEIVLETEVDNVPSLKLYRRLGFRRWKRLHRYYLNGNGAFRLGLVLRGGQRGGGGEGVGADGKGGDVDSEVRRANAERAVREEEKRRKEEEYQRTCLRSMEYLKMVHSPEPES